MTVPPLAEMDLERIPTRRVFSTRGVDLFDVQDGLFLGDSLLVIANQGTSELLFFDAKGEIVNRRGRKGRAPGEFAQGPSELLPGPGDNFFAFGFDLQEFTSEGEVEGRITMSRASLSASRAAVMVLDRDRVAAATMEGAFGEVAERRDTLALIEVTGPAMAHRDTVAIWPGLERSFVDVPMGRLLVPIGFARTAFIHANGQRIVAGSSDSLALTVLDASLRPVLRLRAVAGRDVPSGREIELWRERMFENMPFDHPAVRSAWRDGAIRQTFPDIGGVRIDPDNRIWVGVYAKPAQRERRWVVFSDGGQPLGQVALPVLRKGLIPRDSELLAVGPSRIAVLRMTRNDEQYVDVMEFSLPPR